MNNGEHVIGLFQGMFEKNMLTFTPGWDSNAGEPDDFTHVCVIQRRVKEQGVELTSEVDEITVGPASFTAIDPDGPDPLRSARVRRTTSTLVGRMAYINTESNHEIRIPYSVKQLAK